MQIAYTWTTINGNSHDLCAYEVRPAQVSAPLPGILVLQEVFGVDRHIRDVCDRLAMAGYHAIAPSLRAQSSSPSSLCDEGPGEVEAFLDRQPPTVWFDRSARRQALDLLPADERARVEVQLAAYLRPDRPWSDYLADGKRAIAWLRNGPSKGRKVGAMGFCMGGALCGQLAAVEPSLAAAVVFYGFAPPLEAAPAIACPMLGIYADTDVRVNATVPAFAHAMTKACKPFESETYAGASHAFFNDTRTSYNVDAARAAWARTLEWFAATLG